MVDSALAKAFAVQLVCTYLLQYLAQKSSDPIAFVRSAEEEILRFIRENPALSDTPDLTAELASHIKDVFHLAGKGLATNG